MRPTIEEVKEYFKDAEEVVSPISSVSHKFTPDSKGVHVFIGNYFINIKESHDSCCLWHEEYGYAKITKYKTKTNAPTATAKHYGDRPDVIDFNTKYNLNFNLGSAVKYLARAGKKDGETKEKDLKKALDFITRELESNA